VAIVVAFCCSAVPSTSATLRSRPLKLVAIGDSLPYGRYAADAITITICHNDTPWNSEHDPCDGAAFFPNVDWSSYSDSCATASAAGYGSNLTAIMMSVRACAATS
jgi:lysophospholipase L1-like esterase